VLKANLDFYSLQELVTKTTGKGPILIALADAMLQHVGAPASSSEEFKVRVLVGEKRVWTVVGVSFDDRQDILQELEINDVLFFEHEPENEYDPNAVGVNWGEHHIGYISKDMAPYICDIAHKLQGRVKYVVGGGPEKHKGIRFCFERRGTESFYISVNTDMASMKLEKMLTLEKEHVAFCLEKELPDVDLAEMKHYLVKILEETQKEEALQKASQALLEDEVEEEKIVDNELKIEIPVKKKQEEEPDEFSIF
jgi:hypothetical protein